MKLLKRTLLVLMMALIYYMSAQTGSESSGLSDIVVAYINKIYSCFGKLDYNTFHDLTVGFIREGAHFGEFMILGILIYINMTDFFDDHVVWYSVLAGVTYAVSDEIHQYFVPNRVCDIFDIFMDSCGCIVGVIIVHLLIKKHGKRKNA